MSFELVDFLFQIVFYVLLGLIGSSFVVVLVMLVQLRRFILPDGPLLQQPAPGAYAIVGGAPFGGVPAPVLSFWSCMDAQ